MRAEVEGTTHIVGLGMAGLSAAIRLADAGRRVALYEGAGAAGGRCRSFHDKAVGAVIDNGNHLLMSGNDRALAFLERIGARDRVITFPSARFPFLDLATGERWAIEIGDGPLPGWILSPERRVRGASLWAHVSAARIAFAGPRARVADVVGRDGPMVTRFWEPLTFAVLNAAPAEASAILLKRVLMATVARGGRFARPVIARDSLGDAFVDPALAFLASRGVVPAFQSLLRSVEVIDGRASRLHFSGRRVAIGPTDDVILALSPHALARVLPFVEVPDDRAVIVNAHFRLADPPTEGVDILGLVNATTHWIFKRPGLISTTISAAHHLGADAGDADALLDTIWDEVRRALPLDAATRVAGRRLIRERRATFDQSPASLARRPKTTTVIPNIYLAGDAVDTGLPATIEGAIRSGELAARAVQSATSR